MAAVLQRPRQPADTILLNLTLALIVVGVVAVYDSSYARTMDIQKLGNDGAYFLKRQGLYAVLGLLAMMAMSRFGYWKLRRMAGPLILGALVMLLLVYVPHIGTAKNGAHRWIGWGIAQLQPSEFAKLALIIYMGALLSKAAFNVKDLWNGLMVPVSVMGVIALLVEREPDLGTAAIIFLAGMTILYLAGAQLKHLAGITGIAIGLFLIVSLFGHGFRQGRLTTFLHPELDYYGKGYQITRGLVAVGSGGVSGVGIGAGREKFYLPEANTDFIFATIAEETGLWGALLVIGLLFMVGRQGFVIARRTADPFGATLAAGIAAMISWQAVINVAVVTGTVPATGVPLPFVSYGGSSLLFLLTAVGILLNISRHPDMKPREQA